MMQMRSEHDPKDYLQALMNRMDTVTRFGEERFTGMRLGKFFYVIHHSQYQWDRRFNNPKNAALGYVKAADEGCEVHFMKFKGMLCPSQFLLYFVICMLLSYLTHGWSGLDTITKLLLVFAIFIPLFLLITAIETLFESMTDRSIEGEEALLSLLEEPGNPFTYF